MPHHARPRDTGRRRPRGPLELALARPSFAVGWILIFFVILRELSASILLYSVGNEVLAVVVMRLWTEGKAGQVSVIALVTRVAMAVVRANVAGASPGRQGAW